MSNKRKAAQTPIRPSITIVPNWRPGQLRAGGAAGLTAAPAALVGSPTISTYALGDYDDSTTGFAQEILYCKLSVTLSPGGVPTMAFMAGSGIYRDAGGATLLEADIQTFVTDLRSGPPTLDEPLYNADAPNVLVKNPCYIVFELHPPPGLKFVNGDAAIKMQAPLSNRYCNLWHYGVDWIATEDISPTGEDCLLIYFGVRDVADAALHENDRFNINLQTGDQPDVTLIVVDPAIKNRGPKRPSLPRSPKLLPPPALPNKKPARKKTKAKLKKAA